MNPYEFARRHLENFKVKGDEIIPTYCPFCHGGDHRDKFTFALNVAKQTFNCRRGSCAEQGHFSELCKKFGEEMDRPDTYESMRRPVKTYKKPVSVISPAVQKVEDYLKLRGFSPETWQRRGVGEVNGNIAFPYYENGEMVLLKFRKPEKYTGQGRKAWREEGGKTILWGMDLCDYISPLVIVEGEFDALALDECGIPNVISVPSGSEDLSWIENCWDWLERFDRITFWGDNDDAGRKMVNECILRLGEWRCSIVESPYKDANESLHVAGMDATADACLSAKPIPIHGLLNLADVVPVDITKLAKAKSNIPVLDRKIGGFLMGELSVWTGKSGQGKSTLLGQMLIEAVHEGMPVCAYSGELPADRFQYWINLQCAGPAHITTYNDPETGRDITYVAKETAQKIRDWYRNKFWLYDNKVSSENAEAAGIIKLFTYAARRYGCKVFLIDNLMTSNFGNKSESDYYRAQSAFVGELIHFAKAFNVHVHLVAHPKKTNGQLEKESISGTGDISNRADNVFSVDRIDDDSVPDNAVLTILKNRSYGLQNQAIGLKFDEICKRFWNPSDQRGPNKQYGWEIVPEVITKVEQFGDEVDLYEGMF